MPHPLNTIFYGPPCTGKTYNTILRAAQIISGRDDLSYDEALTIFNENLHDRIEFITFHQNYSYEDFIQGLRPDTENSTKLSFYLRDGIFKIIADRAKENLIQSSKNIDNLTEEARFAEALKHFIESLKQSEEIRYNIVNEVYIVDIDFDIRTNSYVAFRYVGNWDQEYRMKFSDLKLLFENDVSERQDVKKLESISGLARSHASYYFKVYNKIKEFIPQGNIADELQIPLEDVEKQNYVIIIDEINRANISRVFGELITLIEPDKRFGASIALPVILPSGDSFIVPSNLYIIGTMNTADKSIALLDIALRRRFEFEAMYPDYKIQGINEPEILRSLNDEIIRLKSEDFQIGHSFFMGNDWNLKDAMNKKVIPLLMEYFMNDQDKVNSILNKAGLQIDKDSFPIKISGVKVNNQAENEVETT